MSQTTDAAPQRLHIASFTVGLVIMLGGTLYPPIMANAAGHADHGLAIALFWAMSAGFIRGIGFIPHLAFWRVIFSGWACAAALACALAIKLVQ